MDTRRMRELAETVPQTSPESLKWRQRASRLGDAIHAKISELRQLMTVGAGLELGSGFAGRARFDDPKAVIDRARRVRKRFGANTKQHKVEQELAQLVRIRELTIKQYRRLERS